MGLKEKRLMKVIEDENIPFHVNTFKDVTKGGELTIEIDWDEWADDHEGLLNLNGYAIQQFTDALVQVAIDDLAAEALREQVKTLRIERIGTSVTPSIELGAGTLTLRVAPAASWEGVVRNSDIKAYLLDTI